MIQLDTLGDKIDYNLVEKDIKLLFSNQKNNAIQSHFEKPIPTEFKYKAPYKSQLRNLSSNHNNLSLPEENRW